MLQSALHYGVNISGVNVMAMDYGDNAAPSPGGKMGDYAIEAATSTFNQLKGLYGSSKTDAQVWSMIGVTPMIGLNDVTTEVFDQTEAPRAPGVRPAKWSGRDRDVVAQPRPGKRQGGDQLRRADFEQHHSDEVRVRGHLQNVHGLSLDIESALTSMC